MTEPAPPTTEYQSLRAPSRTGEVLIDPPADRCAALLQHNRDRSRDSFWTSLQTDARRQLIDDAMLYSRRYRDVPAVDAARPIVMSGHQPTLFHPGVWLKNHQLSHTAGQLDATPINLVIDNDVASGSAIRVPQIDSTGRARWQSVAYDVGGGGVPFEQAEIHDVDCFNRFDAAVVEAISPIVPDPLVTRLWPHARAAIERCGIAGCALAQARHSLEAEWGWQTLELPLGVGVRGLPFARFVMRIVSEAERFVQVYNDCANHYRLWHGIRSSAHPVPNLGTDDGWFEMPLWVYGNQSPLRRGVWAKRDGLGWRLSDRAGRELVLDSKNSEIAAQQLADAASPDFKLRPRALMTTTYSRLVLSDLFLHGIGGGKYDQLTDRIIQQFFEIEPPKFQVVSGTFRLPGVQRDEDRADRIASLQRQIRDTEFQGERFLDAADPRHQDWLARKTQWLAEAPQRRGAAWHREGQTINAEIASHLSDLRDSLRSALTRERQDATSETILASREHSFCLFPKSLRFDGSQHP